MNYFGDGTPQQYLLEEANHVQREHDLTCIQLIGVLLAVMQYFQEIARENEQAEIKYREDRRR